MSILTPHTIPQKHLHLLPKIMKKSQDEIIQETLTKFYDRQRISLARERRERVTKIVLVALGFIAGLVLFAYWLYWNNKPY